MYGRALTLIAPALLHAVWRGIADARDPFTEAHATLYGPLRVGAAIARALSPRTGVRTGRSRMRMAPAHSR